MHHVHLAYCHQNTALVQVLQRELPEVQFGIVSDEGYPVPGSFAAALTATTLPVVLLVTDNFIKSETCMSGMHAALLSLMRQSRVMVIIANGTTRAQGVETPVETHIDKVVYAIQYMNYWQQEYLTLSDRYNHADEQNRTELFQRQQLIHDIADQAGELISALRDAEPIKWAYLSATGFRDIYRVAGVAPSAVPSPVVETPQAPVVPAPPTPPPAEDRHSLHHTENTTAIPVTGPLMFRPVGTFDPPVAAPSEQETTQFDPTPHLTNANDAGEEANGYYADQEIEHTIRDAWAWIERGNRELGLEVFRLAVEQYPEHEHLRLEYKKAQEDASKGTSEALEGDESQAYEAAGQSAFQDSDYLMAKYCWDRAAEANPNLPGIWRKLGLLTSDQLTGYTETSIAYLKKALAQDPNDEEVQVRLRNLGEIVPEIHEPTPEQPEPAPEPVWSPNVSLSVSQPEPLPVAEPEHEEPVAARFEQPVVSDPGPIEASEPLVEDAPAPVYQPKPMPVLRNEIVMVTGATSGIGKATATEFAKHGYRIIITGRRSERLFALRNALEAAYGVEVLPLVFDVREQRAVQAILEQLPPSWKNIDILINNAGLAKGLAPIHEGELEHWETMIDTNIKGLLYVSQIVSRGMVERRKGHIVNLSSSAGKEAYPNGNVYCATKFAVEALTKSMRFDLHKYGIRVSQVSPGHVEETEFALTRFDGDAERAQIYSDFQPLTAHDVAEAIWFIASRPAHVNVQDVYMFGTQQASATVVDRSGR